MTMIVDELLASENRETIAARRQYAAILLAEKRTPGDVEKLRGLMRTLDRTPEQVRDDEQVIQSARSHLATIAAGQNLSEQRNKAANAIELLLAEQQEAMRKFNARRIELIQAQDALEGRHFNAQRSHQQLQSLKGGRPDLLETVDVPELI